MLHLFVQTNKIWLNYPKTISEIAPPLPYLRCTLTEVIRNLLQSSGNSVTSDTIPNQKLLPEIEEFFNSIQTNNQVYKATVSRQISADLSPDVEETTFKNTAKSWFIKTADFGDKYDQLLQHPDGRFTQLLQDLAHYHQIFQQGYDQIILIRPTIYTGYDIQLTAAMQALGYTKEQFQFIIVQPIKLYAFHKPTQKIQPIPDIATDELIQAIGMDALRWYSARVPLTSCAPINISTAGQPTPTDSLYRVQSAHVRCCMLLQQAQQQGIIQLDTTQGDNWQITSPLISIQEYTWDSPLAQTLANQLQVVPDILQQSATEIAPHLIVLHLENMSETCHQWLDTLTLTPESCALLWAIKQTIFDWLENILAISTPKCIDKNTTFVN
jgi:arginyl-tRNA synthetase